METPWLQDPGSMTKRLREYSEIQIEILYEDFDVPTSSESSVLQLENGQPAFVREVLMIGVAPWVYARSVFHPAIGEGEFSGFFHYGPKPLGDLLFFDPRISRESMIEISCVQGHPCRQSLFLIADLPMIMIELFLPDCPLSLL